jgi:hypothetical protein
MAVNEFHKARIDQGVRRKIDSYHYEDSEGNTVEYCESCKRFRPAETVHSYEDCDICETCAKKLGATGAQRK